MTYKRPLNDEPVIRLYFCEVCILSAEEFEKIAKEVWTRAATDALNVADKILMQLLFEHCPRYHEVKAKLGEEVDPLVTAIVDRYEKAWSERSLRIRESMKKGTNEN